MKQKVKLTWRVVSRLGNNKIINQAYIYLIIVPILAKFLSKIKSPLELAIGGTSMSFDFQLPFSWRLFYISAVFFAIASTLYATFSPTIINENKSFGEFLRQRKNYTHLFDYLVNLGITVDWLSSFGLSENDLLKKNDNIVFDSKLDDGTEVTKVSDKDLEKLQL